MNHSPDNFKPYHHPDFKSSIPDRPIDFLDEMVELNKLANHPKENEEVTYMLPGVDRDDVVQIKTTVSKHYQHNPFVRKLLSKGSIEDRPTFSEKFGEKYISKSTIIQIMKDVKSSPKHISQLTEILSYLENNLFISVSEVMELCQHVCNYATLEKDKNTFRVYDKLFQNLHKKYCPKRQSGLFHLTQDDIEAMTKQGIDPRKSSLKQIKQFFNQKNNERKSQ